MDVGASVSRAFERFKPNAVPLVLGVVAVAVAYMVPVMVVGTVAALLLDGMLGAMLTALLTAGISMALFGPLYGGLYTMAGKVCMGAPIEVGDVGYAFKGGRLKEFFLAGAVIQSPQLLGVIPFVGGLLAGLGGIVASFLFAFALVMVAEGAEGKAALYSSKAMVLGNVKSVIILMVVCFFVGISGVIALGVGVFVTAPIALLLFVDGYLGLKAAAQQPQQQQEQAAAYPVQPHQ